MYCRRYAASSLTDSLRSVVRLRRAGQACPGVEAMLSTDSEDKRQKNMCAGRKHGERIQALPVFHRLRPLTSITESDAQISGGETRQDYKDTRRFPGGSLVRSPVPAFRFTGVIPLLWPRFLIPRLTLGSGKAVRSKLDCMHEPPFSPTAAPCPVTIVLSPTRTGVKNTTGSSHW